MAELEIPLADWAERTLVGCAIATPRGAELAADRVRAQDLYDPRLARLFEAALSVASTDEDERIRAAANATGTEVSVVERLVADRAVHQDRSGSFARRVADAARRRDVMSLCARIHKSLGEGAALCDLAGEIRQLETVAVASW